MAKTTIKRKVNSVGNGTLTISLPADWAERYSITKGQELEVTENEGELIIHGSARKKNYFEKEVNIEKKHNQNVRTIISALYRCGYKEININFEEKPPILTIKDVVDGLIGGDIVEEGKNRIRVRFLIDEDEKVEKIIQKMFQKSLYLFDMLNKNDISENDEELRYHRKMLMRLRDYGQRIIYVRESEIAYSHDLHVVVFLLEKIGSALSYILRNSLDKKRNMTKKTVELFSEIHSGLDLLYKAYLQKNEKLARDAYILLRDHVESKVRKEEFEKCLKSKEYNLELIPSAHYLLKLIFALSSRINGVLVMTE